MLRPSSMSPWEPGCDSEIDAGLAPSELGDAATEFEAGIANADLIVPLVV
jgi:hypothetical protein